MSRGQTYKSYILLFLGGILLIATIPLRVLETGFRQEFMSDYYDGFWNALAKDLWFSDGWWDYVGTPLGLAMTVAPVLSIIGAAACLFAATKL